MATVALLETNAHLLQKRREDYQLERTELKAEIEREKRAYERVAEETTNAEVTAGRLEVKRQKLADENTQLRLKFGEERKKLLAEKDDTERQMQETQQTLERENEQLKTKLEQSKKLVKELVKKEPFTRSKTVTTEADSD